MKKFVKLLNLCLILLLVLVSSCGNKIDDVPDDIECICTADYDPVCSVDGKTYSSSCAAGCAAVEVDYEGECTKCGGLSKDTKC